MMELESSRIDKIFVSLSVLFFSLFLFAAGQVLVTDGDFNEVGYRICGMMFLVMSIFNVVKGFVVIKNSK